MSIPKEPRQLMINLMYLVLTAMLALNISSEILNAFQTINESIKKSNGTIVANNAQLYQSLDAKMDQRDEAERVRPYHAKAQQIKAEADKLVAYFEGLKDSIINRSGGIDPKNNHIKNEGDIDQATMMFVEGRPNSKDGGDVMKKKITDFRAFALGLVGNDTARSALEKQIPLDVVPAEKTEENPSGDWARANFFHMPSIAAVTMFSKFQNDIRNTESMIVQELMEEARAGVITFDAITAIAVPTTSYALQGQKIEAQIMLAAYNKTVNPQISSSGGRVTKVEGGIGYWETTAAGTGLQTVNGSLSIIFKGKTITQPWKFQYMVGSAGASLQLDKMNVFYIGVPNPVTVSAAGYNIDDVSLSIPGATLTKTGMGKYDIIVDKPGDLTASINATRPGTPPATVNQQKIRVKYIPDPTPEVAGKTGTFLLSAALFRVQLGVDAKLKNFDFDAKFKVTSFQLSYLPKKGYLQGPYDVVGSSLFSSNADIVNYMKSAKIGDKIFIDNIKAIGPDNRPRTLSNIIINLN